MLHGIELHSEVLRGKVLQSKVLHGQALRGMALGCTGNSPARRIKASTAKHNATKL